MLDKTIDILKSIFGKKAPPPEVLTSLNDLLKAKSNISFRLGSDFITLKLLKIDLEDNSLLFQHSMNDLTKKRLQASSFVHALAELSGVCFSFELPIKSFSFDANADYLKTDIPTNLEYLQRRNNIRIKLPEDEELYIAFKYFGKEVKLPIYDISSTGIAFVATNVPISFRVEEKIPNCKINQIDDPEVTFDFVVYRIQISENKKNICGRLLPNSASSEGAIHNLVSNIAYKHKSLYSS